MRVTYEKKKIKLHSVPNTKQLKSKGSLSFFFFICKKKSVSKLQVFSPLWMFVWFNIPQVAGGVSHPVSWCLMRISLWFILRKILLWWETDVLFSEPSPWHFRNSSMSVFMRLHEVTLPGCPFSAFAWLFLCSHMDVMVQKIKNLYLFKKIFIVGSEDHIQHLEKNARKQTKGLSHLLSCQSAVKSHLLSFHSPISTIPQPLYGNYHRLYIKMDHFSGPQTQSQCRNA